jgi:hypothetical protein
MAAQNTSRAQSTCKACCHPKRIKATQDYKPRECKGAVRSSLQLAVLTSSLASTKTLTFFGRKSYKITISALSKSLADLVQLPERMPT